MAIQTLNITKSGSGRGTVTSDVGGPPIDCGDTCTTIETAGEVVTLTATPTRGSRFIRWTGDIPASTNRVVSYTQTLNPTNINAEFRRTTRKTVGALPMNPDNLFFPLSKFPNGIPETLPYNGVNYVFDSVGQVINDQWNPISTSRNANVGNIGTQTNRSTFNTSPPLVLFKKGSQMVEYTVPNTGAGGGSSRVSQGGASSR